MLAVGTCMVCLRGHTTAKQISACCCASSIPEASTLCPMSSDRGLSANTQTCNVVQTVAAEAGAQLLPVTAASVTGAYFGESERRLRDAFADAQARATARQPAVVFLDEVDTLCPQRAHASGHSARVVAQLLALLDTGAARSQHVRWALLGTYRHWSTVVPGHWGQCQSWLAHGLPMWLALTRFHLLACGDRSHKHDQTPGGLPAGCLASWCADST